MIHLCVPSQTFANVKSKYKDLDEQHAAQFTLIISLKRRRGCFDTSAIEIVSVATITSKLQFSFT